VVFIRRDNEDDFSGLWFSLSSMRSQDVVCLASHSVLLIKLYFPLNTGICGVFTSSVWQSDSTGAIGDGTILVSCLTGASGDPVCTFMDFSGATGSDSINF